MFIYSTYGFGEAGPFSAIRYHAHAVQTSAAHSWLVITLNWQERWVGRFM